MHNYTVESDSEDVLSTLMDVFGPDAIDVFGEDLPEPDMPGCDAMIALDALVETIDQEIGAAGPMRSVSALNSRLVGRQSGELRHIIVQLDRTLIAIPLSQIVEVQRVPSITMIPFVPEWLRGVANLRGEIISVVDGRQFMGMPSNDHGLYRRLVILQSAEKDCSTGLVVDRVVGMRNIHPDRIKPTSAPTESSIGKYLRGVVADGVAETWGVLDIERFFDSEEMRQFDAV